MAQAHRSTLKAKHKSFKSRHATKGELKTRLKGKVEKSEHNGPKKKHISKQDRRNTSNQLKLNKIIQVSNTKKLFEGKNGIPKIVTVIPLSKDCDAVRVIESLNSAIGAKIISGTNNTINSPGQTIVQTDKFNKHKLRYVIPQSDNFGEILQAAQVADFTIFILSGRTEVNAFGELCIRAIESQGVSSTAAVVSSLSNTSDNNDIMEELSARKQNEIKASLFSYFVHFFPATDKIYCVEDSASDALAVARALCQKLPRGISWRDSRPYVLADQVFYDAEESCVVVEGIVRGQGLDPNRLVHIPRAGDFEIDRVVTTQNDALVPDEDREGLSELAELDEDMEEDQADYEDEEEQSAMQFRSGVRLDGHEYFDNNNQRQYHENHKKNIPTGMSSYQASWIVDESDDDEEDDESNKLHDLDNMEEDMQEWETERNDGKHQADEDMDAEEGTNEDNNESNDHMDLSEMEETQQLEMFRKRAEEDLKFPDEVELRPEELARERLRRYRGIKNLRTCTWDANENDPRAPDNWSRLVRITNFRATRNRVIKEMNSLGANQIVEPGTLVRLFIKAPQETVSLFSAAAPFTVYGLLKYEHKQAVINMSITPDSNYEDPVKSKERVIIQCGFRQMIAEPIFSTGSNAENNVYKFDRFLHQGQTSVATVIGPVTLGSVPVVYFKEPSTPEGLPKLIGTGSILDTNANRIITKRVVLTGHPVKIHKKLVTIRYMFFNPEDIAWYRAVPLFTKSGRWGYIKESLGTHGYFKATFDGKLTSQDTVGMALYKRMWPRKVQVI